MCFLKYFKNKKKEFFCTDTRTSYKNVFSKKILKFKNYKVFLQRSSCYNYKLQKCAFKKIQKSTSCSCIDPRAKVTRYKNVPSTKISENNNTWAVVMQNCWHLRSCIILEQVFRYKKVLSTKKEKINCSCTVLALLHFAPHNTQNMPSIKEKGF